MTHPNRQLVVDALKSVVGSPEFDKITDEGFIKWLELFLTGEDVNYPDWETRGYKTEYAKLLAPFKVEQPVTIYRGLQGDQEKGEEIPDWLLESLGLNKTPKIGQKAKHNKKRPTSWTTNIETAKDFAFPSHLSNSTEHAGVVISMTATPENSLMDVTKLHHHLCNSRLDHWKNICEIISKSEYEIAILPGSYDVGVADVPHW